VKTITIGSCGGCPYFDDGQAIDAVESCNHPSLPAPLVGYTTPHRTKYAATPPEWCPLRTAPEALQIEGATEAECTNCMFDAYGPDDQ
jgi:hypothetical protein